MKVIVLGSGVIGVTSAWYLQKAGHEVLVIDRQPTAARETSFANAGQLSFGYTTPWAAPGLPLKAIKWMLRPHSPLIIHPRPSLSMLSWLYAMLKNCDLNRYQHNKSLMLRISSYSRLCFQILRAETGIQYNGLQKGTIQLFRNQKQMDQIHKDVDVLKEDGVHFEILDAAGCIALEPGLQGMAASIAGGLRTPQDETGDCQIFTQHLAELAKSRGVTFQYDTQILELEHDNHKVLSLKTNHGTQRADAYLVCMAAFSPQLLTPLGLRTPIYPVKGYSLTYPIKNEALAPRSTVLDDIYKVAITRLGDSIRVGGTAEVSDYNIRLTTARRKTLFAALDMMFPGSYDQTHSPALWSGLRPVTPDSVPILGKTPYSNLFTNAGHGTLGWTMAAGCGQFIADLISGQKPAIDPTNLDISRYL